MKEDKVEIPEKKQYKYKDPIAQAMYDVFGIETPGAAKIAEPKPYKVITCPVVSKLMAKMSRIKVPITKPFMPVTILRKANGREVRFNGF